MRGYMSIKHRARVCVLLLLPILSTYNTTFANSFVISDNGKKATLTLPLKAQITADTVMREEISVMPLSPMYDNAIWDKTARKFRDHNFLVRVIKNSPVPILFEIKNDSYTCSYNNPNLETNLPDNISIVNSDYKYQVLWSGGKFDMGPNRLATINDSASWLDAHDKRQKFIDLTLRISFPDISKYQTLMDKGGACRGSITMLISNKL